MEQERYTGHQRIDQRSMAMRRVIAEKLRQCTPFAGVLSARVSDGRFTRGFRWRGSDARTVGTFDSCSGRNRGR